MKRRRTGRSWSCVSFQLSQVLVESIEAPVPEAAKPVRPLAHLSQRRRVELRRAPLCTAAALDQPRSLEHAQVLGNGRAADLERGRKLGKSGNLLAKRTLVSLTSEMSFEGERSP